MNPLRAVVIAFALLFLAACGNDVEETCETNTDCSSSESCVEGTCETPEPVSCEDDSGCEVYTCGFNRTCGFRCDFASDCAAGYECADNACVFVAEVCTEDAECNGGFACEIEPGDEIGTCADGCDTDEQCQPGLTCDLGFCRDLGGGFPCDRDSDCAPGVCFEDECTSSCSDDGDCAPGATCDASSGQCTF